MAKPITFEVWLLRHYGLSLKSMEYVNDRAKAVLKARYEDYCKKWEANENEENKN